MARKSTRKSSAGKSPGGRPRRSSPRNPANPRGARVDAPRRRRAAAPATAAPPAPVEDLRPAPAAPRLGDIPWTYGDNRVTAMARDPHWLFAYWELSDEAIAHARREVQDPHGWCVLRVYDTTDRHFDGTNANWYVDIAVHRESNNYYVPVHRPGATIHVDIGIKSHEGWFARIARSSGVEMPRDGIAWDTRTEWMTVWPEAAPPPEYVHRFVPRPGAPGVEVRTEPVPESEIAGVMQALVGEGWTRTEWAEAGADGRAVRWMRWTGPFWREHWRTVADGRTTVEVIFHGERTIVRTTWGERVIAGPWLVTIYGASVRGRRVIDRWSVHYSWVTEEGRARVETDALVGRVLGQVWAAGIQAGSEARLVSGLGASEWLAVGASEWRWIGGSEARLGGASERVFLGASEWRYLGGSESLGASERLFVGASGLLGGSEGWQAGRESGGSEERLGLLGGSEGLAPSGSQWPGPAARQERA